MKCANCDRENSLGRVFCEHCGHKIAPQPKSPSLEAIQVTVEGLQRELLKREEEIRKLEEQVRTSTEEKDQLLANRRSVREIIGELDEKDEQQQVDLRKLDEARDDLVKARDQEPPGTELPLIVESYPVKNPRFDMIFGQTQHLLDFSTSPFRIGASLERSADGSVALIVHHGAKVNIKLPGRKRWSRHAGGERVLVEAGMVMFDAEGTMNARLDTSS